MTFSFRLHRVLILVPFLMLALLVFMLNAGRAGDSTFLRAAAADVMIIIPLICFLIIRNYPYGRRRTMPGSLKTVNVKLQFHESVAVGRLCGKTEHTHKLELFIDEPEYFLPALGIHQPE